MASFKTFFDLIGRDMATPAVNRVSKSMVRLQGTVKKTTAGLKGMSAQFSAMAVGGAFMRAGSGITNMMDKATTEAGRLEFSLAELQGVAQVSEKVLSDLANTARRLGIETQFTPTEALAGLQALAQQGYNANQQMESIESVLLLSGASGGRLPLADSAKLTAQTLKAFGLKAGDAGITIDRMARISTLSGIAIEELAGIFQNASAGAISMGTSFTDAIATLGLIKNIIPSAEMAGSAFAIMTQRLADPNKQAVIKKFLNVDVVDEATGKYRSFSDLLVDISGEMETLTDAQRGDFVNQAFGPRAAKGILSVFAQLRSGIEGVNGETLKGREAMDHFLNAMDEDKVEGFAKSLNELKLDTMEGQMTLLTGSLNTFLGELGRGTAGLTKGAVKAFLSVFNRMLDLFANLPASVKGGIGMFIEMAGVTLKLVGGLFLLRGVMGMLGLSFTGFFLAIGKVLLISAPLLLFISAFALGVYGIVRTMGKDLGGLGGSWEGMFDKIKLGFKGTIDLIRTGALSQSVLDELDKTKNQGVAGFLVTISGVITKAKSFFKGMMAGYDAGLARLSKPWMRLKDAIALVFGDWMRLTNEGGKTVDEWEKKGQGFGGTLSGLTEMVLDFSTGMILLGRDIAKAFEGITVEDVIDGFNTMLEVLKSLGKAVMFVADGISYLGSLGQGADLSRKQMMAEARLFGGDAHADRLRAGFKRIDQTTGEGRMGAGIRRQRELEFFSRVESGTGGGPRTAASFITKQSGAENAPGVIDKIGSAIQQQFSGIADPIDFLGKLTGLGSAAKVTSEADARLAQYLNTVPTLEKLAAKRIEIPVKLGEREVGRAVANVFVDAQEEGTAGADQFDFGPVALGAGE